MARTLDDPNLGRLIWKDRPLALWKGWAMIVVLSVLTGGWLVFAPGPPWAYLIPSLLVFFVIWTYSFGDRLLIEQRLYEHALVTRTLVPFRPAYLLPLVAIDPRSIRTTPRFKWTDRGEKQLPAARTLRNLPWGRVTRLDGPSNNALKVFTKNNSWFVRDGKPFDLSYLHHSDREWIFSFSDDDHAVASIRERIDAEEARIGPHPHIDPRERSA